MSNQGRTKSSIVFEGDYDFTPNPRPLYVEPAHKNQVRPGEPSREDFLKAFVGKPAAPQSDELNAMTVLLGVNESMSVQMTQLKGLSVVKVGLGRSTPVELVPAPTGWAMSLIITEGYKGSTFPLRPIGQVPVVGMMIPCRGDSVTAKLTNLGNAAITMSLAIIPEQETPGQQNNKVASGQLLSIPYQTTNFTLEPEDGVILGDTVDQMDAGGVLIISQAAFAGRVYTPDELATSVRYTPVGPGVFVYAKFFTNK